MLVWPIAPNDPSAIEAIATNTTICRHSVAMPGKATTLARTNTAMPATLGAEAKKAVTGVGAPSLAATLDRIAAFAAGVPDGATVIGQGWDESHWPERRAPSL